VCVNILAHSWKWWTHVVFLVLLIHLTKPSEAEWSHTGDDGHSADAEFRWVTELFLTTDQHTWHLTVMREDISCQKLTNNYSAWNWHGTVYLVPKAFSLNATLISTHEERIIWNKGLPKKRLRQEDRNWKHYFDVSSLVLNLKCPIYLI